MIITLRLNSHGTLDHIFNTIPVLYSIDLVLLEGMEFMSGLHSKKNPANYQNISYNPGKK